MALIRFRDSGPKPFGAVGAYEKLPCTSEALVPDLSFGKPVKPSLLLAISMMVKSGVAALHVHLVLETFRVMRLWHNQRACSSVG